MLGRLSDESGVHAAVAAQQLGLALDEGLHPASIGTLDQALETVARIADVGLIVRIGHPAQPDADLENSLIRQRPGVVLSSATQVARQWVWVGRQDAAPGGSGGVVVVDERAYEDLSGRLAKTGLAVRLVPAGASMNDRIRVAGSRATMIIEAAAVPEGWHVLPGSQELTQGPDIWFGQVIRYADVPADHGRAIIWLVFGPDREHTGSLREVLSVFADQQIDLKHIRSGKAPGGQHAFFTAFQVSSGEAVAHLRAALEQANVAHRVLAVIPNATLDAEEEELTLRWDTL